MTDTVALIRALVSEQTGARTAVVLQPGFTTGPMPLVHVARTSQQDTGIDLIDTLTVDCYATTPPDATTPGADALADVVCDALTLRPVCGGGRWADSAEVTERVGVRPYFEAIEVVSMTVDVTHRP